MYLDITEIKDLIEGRIKYRKCPCCDTNGTVWFDSTKTSGVLPYPHTGIPEEDLGWETCHNCDGLSYILYRQENEMWGRCNLHAHVHNATIPDSRYFNCSLENIDYTPISLDQIREILKERKE